MGSDLGLQACQGLDCLGLGFEWERLYASGEQVDDLRTLFGCITLLLYVVTGLRMLLEG